MTQVLSCQSYHGITAGQTVLNMPDGRSVFKLYLLSIVGRNEPVLYDWASARFSMAEFEARFCEGSYEGVGFVTAFPHITKIFRYAPEVETVIDVRELDTASLDELDCSRDDQYHEFACYAESLIVAEEYRAWARADSVDEYLQFRCSLADFPIGNHNKLSDYWDRSTQPDQ